MPTVTPTPLEPNSSTFQPTGHAIAEETITIPDAKSVIISVENNAEAALNVTIERGKCPPSMNPETLEFTVSAFGDEGEGVDPSRAILGPFSQDKVLQGDGSILVTFAMADSAEPDGIVRVYRLPKHV